MADTTTKLVGHNYTPPDLVVKMTGQAKYAEDFRAEGMLFTKLLLSPMPHAQVRNIGASAALVMPSVHAILTEEDCPNPGSAMLGEGGREFRRTEHHAGNDPHERTALPGRADSRRRGRLDREDRGRPRAAAFVVDPIETLRPGSPNPRTEGNVWVGNHVETLKWIEEDWQEVEAGRLPLRDAPEMWEVGAHDPGWIEGGR